MCSTPCKIRSTPCKICSTKQSYPQVIPELSLKRCYNCKMCSTPAKYGNDQNTQYPMQNNSTKQSYPCYPQRVIPKKVLQTAKHAVPHAKIRTAKYAMQTCGTPVKYAVPNAKHAVPHAKICSTNKVIPKLSPELSQWICRRKNDLKNKSKCFILT